MTMPVPCPMQPFSMNLKGEFYFYGVSILCRQDRAHRTGRAIGGYIKVALIHWNQELRVWLTVVSLLKSVLGFDDGLPQQLHVSVLKAFVVN